MRSLAPEILRGIRRGIEKESLRVRPDGSLASTPHAPALGAALTHPHITTDFSESQLELITGPHERVDACLEELTEIHKVVYRTMGGDELMWAGSMPCNLPADDSIPIGRYGKSNVGRAKNVYRMGLSHRYGRRMQTISGIHYNLSIPGTTSEQYFALIRNFRRRSWLLLYLFGASPAVCSSFVAGRQHELQELAPGTMYALHGTSLRMGRLGYQSEAQASLAVSYNSLKSYTASLYDALTKPYEPYEKIGILKNNEYLQLNTTLLQIENEFYSTVRPKRRIKRGERPLHALRERGVEYVEVRLMDLDPFVAIGIGASTMRFLDVFLLHCLLDESPDDTPEEIAALSRNQQAVALKGREPGLQLERGKEKITLMAWGRHLLDACLPIAKALDAAHGGGTAYLDALMGAAVIISNPNAAPSARVLHAMARNHANSYVRFALAESMLHAGSLRSLALGPGSKERFERLATESLAEQRRLEAADKVDFETFRKQYLSPDLLRV
ncbi:glutamate--cysteine ligase [Betaproteobacteria bacterium SCGC AG-212-J23]|nr:glutamate--cysteine ligase [Betaproteobacteria bacterium SCGC AG-212-J23]